MLVGVEHKYRFSDQNKFITYPEDPVTKIIKEKIVAPTLTEDNHRSERVKVWSNLITSEATLT